MKNLKNLAILIGCLMAFITFYLVFAQQWQEPPYGGVCSNPPCPPGGNVPAPINVGSQGQYKSGGLGIGGIIRGYSNAYFDGNVGIGTTSTNARLHIQGSSGSIGLRLGLNPGQPAGYTNSPMVMWDSTNMGATRVYWMRQEGNIWRFKVSDTSWGNQYVIMSADTNGNVGIGTTGPAYKLDVVGALRLQPSSQPTGANGVIYYDSSRNKFRCYQNNAWVDCIASGGLGGSGTTNYVAKFTGSTTLGNSQIFDNGTSVGIGKTNPSSSYKLDVNGSVRATAFYYTSDIALKENIRPLENSLAKILQLQGVSFNWKESGEPFIGLIAQEVEKIFPEVVSGEEGQKTIDYGKLVPVLIEAIKEQQREIDKLKAEIEAIKSK